MLRSAEPNMFSMTNTIYRDLVCRANGEIYRLSDKTPWRYDGKASCMSKQTVTLLYWLLVVIRKGRCVLRGATFEVRSRFLFVILC